MSADGQSDDTSNDIVSWLRSRSPTPPKSFQDWVTPENLELLSQGSPSTDFIAELTAQAERALRRALDRPGRNREAAFHLLAAGAYYTYACEAAADTSDVLGSLEQQLARFGRGSDCDPAAHRG